MFLGGQKSKIVLKWVKIKAIQIIANIPCHLVYFFSIVS